ncbi:hypothetical protein ACFE04_014227 [Oxalis oulophora]
MVMDGDRERECDQVDEGNVASTPSTSAEDLLQEISGVIESVAQLGEYRRTQKKECCGLARRLKHLLPLLEEIRDIDSPIDEAGIVALCNLKKVLLMARKLLRTCNDGSKIYLSLESESVMARFHSIYDKLGKALDDIPLDDFEISDEVKEQIELMVMQLRRARRRTDTQDIELAMDMMVVFSKTDERNADNAIIERLAKKLELHSHEDLKNETMAVRNLIRERGGVAAVAAGGPNAESTQHIVDLLNRFKKIAGMEVNNSLLEEPAHAAPKKLQKCYSLMIPQEFLCPISLEIMTDPVIVASGVTYEKASIQKWIDSNHRTCPKTRQTLAHLSLAPNFALKNLILQWCEKNNFQIPKKDEPHSNESETSTPEHKEEIASLIQSLASTRLEVQRDSAKKIRLLSKENPENRVLIANCGGIPPLVQILSYPDSKIQEHAVTALLNLSIDEANKKRIASEGAIPAIIGVLENGSKEARENSAAALFSLSMLDENKVTVGLSNGIPPLVNLLQNGTMRGKRDAVTALFNLSLNQANKARAVDAGIVAPLLQLLKDRNLGMVDEALSIFLLLATHPEGRHAIGQLSFIEILVEFIRDGTPKNKECAASVLLELGSNNSSSFILAALQFGVYEHLVVLAENGTNRAQRKANALLQLIIKSEQI